jgi:hypothetical protein
LTVRRTMRSGYPAEKSGFAGAVCAYKRNRFTVLDMKAHLAKGLQQPKPNIQGINRKEAHSMTPPK